MSTKLDVYQIIFFMAIGYFIASWIDRGVPIWYTIGVVIVIMAVRAFVMKWNDRRFIHATNKQGEK